ILAYRRLPLSPGRPVGRHAGKSLLRRRRPTLMCKALTPLLALQPVAARWCPGVAHAGGAAMVAGDRRWSAEAVLVLVDEHADQPPRVLRDHRSRHLPHAGAGVQRGIRRPRDRTLGRWR